MALIIGYDKRKQILNALIAEDAPLDPAGITLKLLLAPLDVNVDTTRDDLLLAEATTDNFPGYADINPLTWSDIFRDGSSNVFVDAGEVLWITTDVPPEPVSVVGVMWDDGVNWIVDLFAAPQTVNAAEQVVRYIPQFGYGQ